MIFGWSRTKTQSSNRFSVVGDGEFDFEIVGEASYQPALLAICGGKKRTSQEIFKQAVVILDDENPYDSKAVRVEIEGQTVGFLSRSDARLFRKSVNSFNRHASQFQCKAVVSGGWKDSSSEGHFGVRLDIAQPFAFAEARA